MDSMDRAQFSWSQPALFQAPTNHVAVEICFYIEGNRDMTMVGYEARTPGDRQKLVAAGLTWCGNWRDRAIWSEVVHEILEKCTRAIEPF